MFTSCVRAAGTPVPVWLVIRRSLACRDAVFDRAADARGRVAHPEMIEQERD
jgi:hypothetical protein